MAMVTLTREHWKALVAYIRSEEKVLLDNFGTPGSKRTTWERRYKQMDPAGYELLDKARKAIRSVR